MSVLALFVLAPPLLAWPTPAPAQENARRAELLRSVEDGQRTCEDLDPADFEEIGDYMMGRMVGSQQAHESIDAMMRGMMGQSGEARMHTALGQRFSGCGTGRFPAGAAGMMNGLGGMFGMMGGGLGPGSGSESGGGQGYGPGAMMGGFGDDRDDDDVGAGWMIVIMLLVVGVVATGVYFGTRQRGGASAPVDVLAQRFARGEIDAEQYQERRGLLEGLR